MKKLASLLLGLGLLVTTAFSQAKQETKKQTVKAKTETKSTTVLKKDGTPDKRFKENKDAKSATVVLKKDGTPDKRYKETKTVKVKKS